jgi:hypothetical protein
MRDFLGEIGELLKSIEGVMRQYDLQIRRLLRQDERCSRLVRRIRLGSVTTSVISIA